jgi:hypothetical protein
MSVLSPAWRKTTFTGLLLIHSVSGFVAGPMFAGRARPVSSSISLRSGHQASHRSLFSMMAFDSSYSDGNAQPGPSTGVNSAEPTSIDALRYCIGKVNPIGDYQGCIWVLKSQKDDARVPSIVVNCSVWFVFFQAVAFGS